MNEPVHTPDSLEVEQRRHQLCREFEKALQAGQTPYIEAYLQKVPEAEHGELLRELLGLEIDYLAKNGQPPDVADLLLRFPRQQELVNAVLQERARRAAGLPGTSPTPDTIKGLPEQEQPTGIHHTTGTSSQPATPSIVIPGYELLGEPMEGGMAVVWKAREVKLNRLVALKMIKSGPAAGSEARRDFQAEAEAVAQFQHPNIVQIFAIGEHAGQPYFTMEFMEGGSLAKKLNGTPQPPREAAQLVETIARAMDYAHQRRIIHRDLKPANILLQKRETRIQKPETETGASSFEFLDSGFLPKVSDFGLNKLMPEHAEHVEATRVCGTPSYMAPEQTFEKGRITPATDVYALGAILYCMLTGRPPFTGENQWDIIAQVVKDDPVPPRRLQPRVPRDLETICLKCLEKEAGKRYASAAELTEDLRRFGVGEPIVARPVSAWERAVKWTKRRPALAAATSLAVTLLVVIATSLAVNAKRQADNAQQQRILREKADESALRAQLAAAASAKSEEKAIEEQHRAENEADKSSLLTYLAEMKVVHFAWQNNDVSTMVKLLNRQRSEMNVKRPNRDHRGFEWYYWHHLLNRGQPLALHLDEVSCLTISPNGHWVVTGCGNTVKVWDAEKKFVVHSLKGHTAPVTCVATSPNGKYIASGSYDKTLRIWDAAKGDQLFSLATHTQPITCLAIVVDGAGFQRIVSGSSSLEPNGELKVWDLETRREIRSFATVGGVQGLAVSTDARRIASVGNSGTIKVWDVEKAHEALTLKGHQARVVTVAFSPNGHEIVGGDERGELRIWNVESGKELGSLMGHAQPVSCLGYSPNGERIVSGSMDRTLKIWDRTTITVPFRLDKKTGGNPDVVSLKGHTEPVLFAAFSQDGKYIVSSSASTTLKWRGDEKQEFPSLRGGPLGEGLSCVAMSPKGDQVVSGTQGAVLRVWNRRSGIELFSLKGHTGPVTCVAIAPDGKYIVSGSYRGLEPQAGGTLKMWDTQNGREVPFAKAHTEGVACLAISSDGKYIVSGSPDGILTIWQSRAGKELFSLKAHKGGVACVAISPDGNRIISGGGEFGKPGELKVWHRLTAREVLSLNGHSEPVTCVAITPEGRYIVSGSSDKTLKVWDRATGQELLTLNGHAEPVTCVAITADGKRIVSGAGTFGIGKMGGELKVWDRVTGQEVLSLYGTEAVTCVATTSDSKCIVSGSWDNTLRLWDASLSEPK